MPTHHTQLTPPTYYNLHTTCHTHGWKYLAPFTWHDAHHTLQFAMLINGNDSDIPIDIQVQQTRSKVIEVHCTTPRKLRSHQQDQLNAGIQRTLDLTTDTRELFKLARSIKPAYSELVSKGAGRLLKSPTLWEDAAKTLFTTNCTWHLTTRMAEAACSADFSDACISGVYPFPAAQVVARKRESSIKDKMNVGYRAGFVKNLALFFRDPENEMKLNALDAESLRAQYASLKGFGPYATNHMMILSGFFTEIPVDTVVKAYFKKLRRKGEPAEIIERCYGKWGEYKWWGMKIESMAKRVNWLGD